MRRGVSCPALYGYVQSGHPPTLRYTSAQSGHMPDTSLSLYAANGWSAVIASHEGASNRF